METETIEVQEQAPKKKSALKKVLNVVYYVVLAAIMLVVLFYIFMTFSTKGGVTSVFGHIIFSVQSDSMSGTFETGDMLVIKEVKDTSTIQKEDIITFYYIEPQTNQKIIVTHRVIDIQDGRFITQGDVARRNNSVDKIEKVSGGDVIGTYTNIRIPGLGKAADFLKSSVGFFVCVLIPVFLFLFWQLYVFVKTLTEARSLGKQKAVNDEARALAEEMFQKMQQEQLQQQQQQQADSTEAAAPPAEESDAPAEDAESSEASTEETGE